GPLAKSYHRCAIVSRTARDAESVVVRAMAMQLAAALLNSSERSGITPHTQNTTCRCNTGRPRWFHANRDSRQIKLDEPLGLGTATVARNSRSDFVLCR